jgi:predicted nucleic acid-binding protein
MAIFIDTVYLLALINPNDNWRDRALDWAKRIKEPLVTTEAVLTEVADALSRSDRRRWAVEAIRDLRSDPEVTCVSVTPALFGQAFDLYADRADKDWSLTDCISFATMRARRIERALTADVHFIQGGFQALLRD